MGDVISGVGAVAGGISDLVGGGGGGSSDSGSTNSYQSFNRTLGDENPEDIRARKIADQNLYDVSGQSAKQYEAANKRSQQVDELFKDMLTKFTTGSATPSPQQYQQATQYVDQTFTVPAQQQYGKFLDQASEMQANRAAASGRSSQDTAYQREFAGQASQAAQDLTNQRGSLIAQRADYLSSQLPQQQLGQLFQGAQYFNTPLQQAFSNRLNLLNGATQQQTIGLARQQAEGGYTMTNQGLTNASQQSNATTGDQIANFGKTVGNAANTLGNVKTPTFLQGATPPSLNPYTSGVGKIGFSEK